jgi:hypothetical protein
MSPSTIAVEHYLDEKLALATQQPHFPLSRPIRFPERSDVVAEKFG